MEEEEFFRREASEARAAGALGSSSKYRAPSLRWMFIVSTVLGIATILFCVFGTLARRVTLPGVITLKSGTPTITSPAGGTVSSVFAKEGDFIEQGARIFAINVDRQGFSGGTGVQVEQALKSRLTGIDIETKLAGEMARNRQNALLRKREFIVRERKDGEAEISAIASRLAVLTRTVAKFKELARDGFVTELQLQDKEGEMTDVQSRLAASRRMITSLDREEASIQSELELLRTELSNQQLGFQRSQAQLQQEILENEARTSVFVKASIGGRVGLLSAQVGQAVSAGQALATLLPENALGESTAEATLFSQSRAIGFIREGQPVNLRLDSFPYQKYGMARGVVTAISLAAVRPQDLAFAETNATRGSSDLVYRITVKLDNQQLSVGGRPVLLRPGMALEADVQQERRAVWEWLFEPLLMTWERGR